MAKMRVCDAAVEVLRETDNPAIMHGDHRLAHDVAEKLGWKHEAWETHTRVMAALNRTPGILIKELRFKGPRASCVYILPECHAEYVKNTLRG